MAIATRPLRRARMPWARMLAVLPVAVVVVMGTLTGLMLSAALERALPPGGPGPGGAPTFTAAPSASPTPRPTPRAIPTLHPTPTVVPTPRATPTLVPTPLPTPVPTAVPTVAPTPIPPPDPPACRYDDLLTFHRDLGDWRITLLDTIYMLPGTYAPGDLVDSSAGGLNGGYPIRSFVVADLAELVSTARAAGVNLAVVSGYRSHVQQAATFQHWVDVAGYEAALRTSARAGHSEHQLGTTLDFTTAAGRAPWEYADWATTREGAWMAANAWRFGFVMSYPRGSIAETCYDYEPWHYRYVGRELAARIQASGLTPRQVLWTLQ